MDTNESQTTEEFHSEEGKRTGDSSHAQHAARQRARQNI